MSANGPTRFSRDTTVEQISETQWRAQLAPGWDIQGVPNGGYVMALAARALGEALPHPDPISVTGYYLERTVPGPVAMEFERLRAGNSVSTGVMKLVQEGVERARFMASYGDLDALRGPDMVSAQPPQLPAPDQCVGGETPIEISKRLDLRMPAEQTGWMQGKPGERAQMEGWLRLREGGEPDPVSLLLFADGFPPAVFARFGPAGWVPTLELTVQVRARPAPGWILGRFVTRYLTGGQMEEDGELWDSKGQLVALSRQLARFRLPPGR